MRQPFVECDAVVSLMDKVIQAGDKREMHRFKVPLATHSVVIVRRVRVIATRWEARDEALS